MKLQFSLSSFHVFLLFLDTTLANREVCEASGGQGWQKSLFRIFLMGMQHSQPFTGAAPQTPCSWMCKLTSPTDNP